VNISFIEVNVPSGLPGERKARLRADKIIDVRDDFRSEGKGKERVPILRVIMEGGANVVVDGETIDDFWRRLTNAYSQGSLVVESAPDITQK